MFIYHDNSSQEIFTASGHYIPRVKITGRVFLNLQDVKRIYLELNNHSTNRLEIFVSKAKLIARKNNGGIYSFVNEEALFKLFQDFLPNQLKAKEITCWGELMQFIS